MRYNEPKRGLFSRLAEAGSAGLGIAAQNVIPFHQYNQRQQQDQQDRASLDQYRQQQLTQDEDQFQRQQNQGQWKTMMDMWGQDAKRGVNYGGLKPSDIPSSVSGLMAYGLYKNDPALVNRVSPYYNEQNSVEDRVTQPKAPPSMYDTYNAAYGKAEAERRNREKAWKENPMNWVDQDTMVPFNELPVDQEKVWQGSVGSQIPNWRARFGSDVFGTNAADSGRGLVGLPPQEQADPYSFEVKQQFSRHGQPTGQITREQALAELRRRGKIQ